MEMRVSCLLLLLRVFTYGTINKGFAFAYLGFTLIVFFFLSPGNISLVFFVTVISGLSALFLRGTYS